MDLLTLIPALAAVAAVAAAVFALLAWRGASASHRTTSDPAAATELAALRQALAALPSSWREDLERSRTAQAHELSAVRGELREGTERQHGTLASSVQALMTTQTAAAESTNEVQRRELAATRAELAAQLQTSQQALAASLKEGLASLSTRSDAMRTELADTSAKTRRDLVDSLAQARAEQATGLTALQEATQQRLTALAAGLAEQQGLARKEASDTMAALQASNEAKLEAMRATVQEKLDATLGERLDASFKQVSERLETVHKGLGEMQVLAQGVGSLQRTLTNVKTRGVWGELQLEALLTDLLTADQFRRQFRINPESAELADFAIKLPGRSDDSPVWLAVDSKFPMDAYEALQAAWEGDDTVAVKQLTKALLGRIDAEAASIRSKYVNPPHTTDFAVMYLPTEGLFAEVTRHPGFLHELRRKHQVVVAGPTTLTALLGSLSMGFRTLAIEKRSSEVWKVLSAVKQEFENSAGTWERLVKQLDTARNTADLTGRRHRAIERKLRDVEVVPDDDAAALPAAVVDPEGAAAGLLPAPRPEATAFDELMAETASTD